MAATSQSQRSNIQELPKKPAQVFEIEVFEIFISRMVRRLIAVQFCEPDHPVILTEEQLIARSKSQIQKHLAETVGHWESSPWRIRKIVVIRHLRALAKERLLDHMNTQGLDDDAAKNVYKTILKTDFEEVFPKEWIDS